MASKNKRRKTHIEVTCSNCGEEFKEDDLDGWRRVIRNWRPACSDKCAEELGQVIKDKQ